MSWVPVLCLSLTQLENWYQSDNHVSTDIIRIRQQSFLRLSTYFSSLLVHFLSLFSDLVSQLWLRLFALLIKYGKLLLLFVIFRQTFDFVCNPWLSESVSSDSLLLNVMSPELTNSPSESSVCLLLVPGAIFLISDRRWMRFWVSCLWTKDSSSSISANLSFASWLLISRCFLLESLASLAAFATANLVAFARLPTGSSFRPDRLGKGEHCGRGAALRFFA